MSINVVRTKKHGFTQLLSISVASATDLEDFAEMVQRAVNLWPDAPPAIKVFADQITNEDLLNGLGKDALQDYSPSYTRSKDKTNG